VADKLFKQSICYYCLPSATKILLITANYKCWFAHYSQIENSFINSLFTGYQQSFNR